ncbi:hypothetical protein [Desulfoferula mesophila]|uniref:Uncharacterized protein n=1 Tax=Desulfoferula mesophila TaxID=3058419 RepID=A0AAU9EQP1_9BACT|nr:hypothetical protein FAK_24800 [Desulfoferula mesophilus]
MDDKQARLRELRDQARMYYRATLKGLWSLDFTITEHLAWIEQEMAMVEAKG